MKDLRRRFERFCLKNRGKGIPNLMLVIAIGNLVVYVLSRVTPATSSTAISASAVPPFCAGRSGGCLRTSLRI